MMNAPRKTLAAVLLPLAAMALTAAPLAAQDDRISRERLPTVSVEFATVSVEFAGGSLSEFAELIRKSVDGDEPNIVLPAIADDVAVPAMRMTNVSVLSALQAAGSVTPQLFHCNVTMLESGPGRPVHMVQIVDHRQPEQVRSLGLRSRVYQLSSVTRPMPGDPKEGVVLDADTVLTAINTGLALEQGESEAALRYHADSGLLFARGTTAQLTMIDSVVSELSHDVQARRLMAQRVSVTSTVSSGR